jgi:hypothetical protein
METRFDGGCRRKRSVGYRASSTLEMRIETSNLCIPRVNTWTGVGAQVRPGLVATAGYVGWNPLSGSGSRFWADVRGAYRGSGAGARKRLKMKKEVEAVMVYTITKEGYGNGV